MKRYVLPLISILGLGCGHEPLDQLNDEGVHIETDGFAVTKPKNAPPGSLGGICGVDYADCPDSQTMFDRFRALPKTNIAFTRELKNMDAANNLRKLTMKYRVPRMVNDHKESKDQITIINEAANFDGSGGDVKVTYQRNGSTVAIFSFDRNGRKKEETVDINKGGWETIMATASDKPSRAGVLYRFALETTKTKGPNIVKNLFCSGGDTIGTTKQRCFWCKTTQVSIAIAPGFGALLITRLFRFKQSVQTAIEGAGIMAGGAGGVLYDCNKVCGRQDCTENYCQGRISASQYDLCCRMNGGYVAVKQPGSSVGECSDNLDMI